MRRTSIEPAGLTEKIPRHIYLQENNEMASTNCNRLDHKVAHEVTIKQDNVTGPFKNSNVQHHRHLTCPSALGQGTSSVAQTSYSGAWNSLSTAARKAQVRGLMWKIHIHQGGMSSPGMR